jgi:rod shape-determining protein MreD
MEEVSPRFRGAIILSLIIAFALTILPIRDEWVLFKPEWLALTLIHWGLMSPSKSSLMLAWFVGLLVDSVYGSTMGQHALGFTIVLFMTLRMRPRLLVDSFFQQLFLLFVVLGTYLLINLWILGITGHSPKGWGYWITVLSSLFIWPFYHYFLGFFHAVKKSF